MLLEGRVELRRDHLLQLCLDPPPKKNASSCLSTCMTALAMESPAAVLGESSVAADGELPIAVVGLAASAPGRPTFQ